MILSQVILAGNRPVISLMARIAGCELLGSDLLRAVPRETFGERLLFGSTLYGVTLPGVPLPARCAGVGCMSCRGGAASLAVLPRAAGVVLLAGVKLFHRSLTSARIAFSACGAAHFSCFAILRIEVVPGLCSSSTMPALSRSLVVSLTFLSLIRQAFAIFFALSVHSPRRAIRPRMRNSSGVRP
jgi:hypothetical protein